jgi:hypothetical protein
MECVAPPTDAQKRAGESAQHESPKIEAAEERKWRGSMLRRVEALSIDSR